MPERATAADLMQPSDPPVALRSLLEGQFFRDGAIVFASTMAVNVLNYAIHFILSRKLGVAQYGAFASLMAAMAILGLPSGFIVMTVTKFVAEFHALGDKARIREVSRRALTAGGSLAVVSFILAVIFKQRIASYLHLTSSISVVATALVLGLSFTVPIMWAVLQGTQDFSRLALSSFIEAASKMMLGVGLVFLGFGVAGAFFGYAIAIALTVFVTMPFLRRHWTADTRRVRLHIDTKRLLHTTGGVVVATSAITVLGYIDVPLVKHFFSAHDAGIYGAVSVCGKMLFFLVGFVPTLVLPKAARHAVTGGRSGYVLLQGLFLTASLAFAALSMFALFGPMIVKITYGIKFLPAAKYIFMYGCAMALLAATNVVVNYKIGLHRHGFVLPLVFIAVAEPVAIQYFHATLWMVIDVLLVGNAAALAASLAISGKRDRPSVLWGS